MAKFSLVKGSTSVMMDIFIQDSSVTTGAGLTGLTAGSSGLTCYYHRASANAAVQVSLTASTLGTWTSAGFIVVDGTNMPGMYQLDLPDAAFATGANSVSVLLKGATNMAPLPLEIELTGTNNQDAVRGGMTALPNAAAEAAGGLYTRGTGTGQINQAVSGTVDVNLVDIAGAALSTASAQIGVNVVSYATGQAPLQPTTASRKLNVTTTGEAGIDWGDVANQATTVSLSNTTISGSTSTPTVAQIATAVWQDSTAGDFTTASSIGKALYINNVVPGGAGGHFIAGTNAATTITTALTTTFTGDLTGSVGSLATQAKADVKAQAVAALATDTYAEPGQGTPASTNTLAAKIGYIMKAWLNKSTQTASEYDLYNSAGAVVDQKATVSDDGTTFTRGNVVSGP